LEEDLADENKADQNTDEEELLNTGVQRWGLERVFSAHRVSRRTEAARAVCPGSLAHLTI
jgi:hypothetical protein